MITSKMWRRKSTCCSMTCICSRNWENIKTFSGTKLVLVLLIEPSWNDDLASLVCKGKLFSVCISSLLLSVYKPISSFVPCKAFNLLTRYATLLLDVDCQSGSQLSCSFNNQHCTFRTMKTKETNEKKMQVNANWVLNKNPACLYEGCSSIRSLGTAHFGLGFSGRAIASGLCISYKLPHPGYVHFVLSIETQSRHNRCRHGVMRGRRHHSLHLHNLLNN